MQLVIVSFRHVMSSQYSNSHGISVNKGKCGGCSVVVHLPYWTDHDHYSNASVPPQEKIGRQLRRLPAMGPVPSENIRSSASTDELDTDTEKKKDAFSSMKLKLSDLIQKLLTGEYKRGELTTLILEALAGVSDEEVRAALPRNDDTALNKLLSLLKEEHREVREGQSSSDGSNKSLECYVHLLWAILRSEPKAPWMLRQRLSIAHAVTDICVEILASVPTDGETFVYGARAIISCFELCDYCPLVYPKSSLKSVVIQRLNVVLNESECNVMNLLKMQLLLTFDDLYLLHILGLVRQLEKYANELFQPQSGGVVDTSCLVEYRNTLYMIPQGIRQRSLRHAQRSYYWNLLARAKLLVSIILKEMKTNVSGIPNKKITDVWLGVLKAVLNINETFEDTTIVKNCFEVLRIVQCLREHFEIDLQIALTVLNHTLAKLSSLSNQCEVRKKDLDWIPHCYKFNSCESKIDRQISVLVARLYGHLTSFNDMSTLMETVILDEFVTTQSGWETNCLNVNFTDLTFSEEVDVILELNILVMERLSRISENSLAYAKLFNIMTSPTSLETLQKSLVSPKPEIFSAAISILFCGVMNEPSLKTRFSILAETANKRFSGIHPLYNTLKSCSVNLHEAYGKVYDEYLRCLNSSNIKRIEDTIKLLKSKNSLYHQQALGLRTSIKLSQDYHHIMSMLYTQQTDEVTLLQFKNAKSDKEILRLEKENHLLQDNLQEEIQATKTKSEEFNQIFRQKDVEENEASSRVTEVEMKVVEMQSAIDEHRVKLQMAQETVLASEQDSANLNQKIRYLTQRLSALEKEKCKVEEEKRSIEELSAEVKGKIEHILTMLGT